LCAGQCASWHAGEQHVGDAPRAQRHGTAALGRVEERARAREERTHLAQAEGRRAAADPQAHAHVARERRCEKLVARARAADERGAGDRERAGRVAGGEERGEFGP
jgi:hypothetical protein